jgi:hypothetical protein
MAELSQPTLGILRRILEQLRSEEPKTTKFWKDALFDFGFAPVVIDFAASYEFRWGEIISDLFVGKFGRQNEYFANALSPYNCEQTLKRLAALALFHSRGIPIGDKFRKSLTEDGFDLKADSGNDFLVPVDVQQKLDSSLTDEESQTKPTMPPSNPGILVLISHSSKDADLALALIELLRAGLGLVPTQIRCSSVDGYRLPAGVNTDVRLRKEIAGAGVLVGLLTPDGLASTYVLFELGARWGNGQFMIPLLAGVKPEDMRGPHRVLNALSCSNESQLIQFIEDTGKELEIQPQSSASYLDKVRNVKKLSDAVENRSIRSASAPEMVYEESVYWKMENGKREGPYCPNCYDNKHQTIHLNPGATKGTYGCGTCGNGFHINEYTPRPTRRRPFSSR